MRYLRNPHTDPYYNMAFDEFCLENLPIDEPVFYLWQNRPAVIIGLNQEVNTEVNLDYLKENYGITYDKKSYIVDYSYFGANVRPTVRVIEK